MAEHAKLFSASGSAKWLVCGPSPHAEARYEDPGSDASREGTCAHEVAALALATGKDPVDWLGAKFEGVEVSQDIVDYVRQYVDYVRNRAAQHGAVLMIEQRLDFSAWAPEGFGTGDAVIVYGRTIEVIDLKYGKGIRVPATTPQLKLYALGAYSKHDWLYGFERVICTVFQPRMDNVDSIELTTDELLAFGEHVRDRVNVVMDPNAPLVAGSHCTDYFCKHRHFCPARAELAMQTCYEDFSSLPAVVEKPPVNLRDVGTLTAPQVNALTQHLDAVEAWCNDLRKRAFVLAGNGELRDFKLVAGRSVRVWKADADAALKAALEDKGVDVAKRYKAPALANIGDMEKLLGKNHEVFKAATFKPDGKPTLAAANDKRPALDSATSLLADFGDPAESSED